MESAHGGYGTNQMPLAGAILCCTSIPPEQRTELGAIGSQMGATIKLDLTSDVTHLIVGSINSAKYRYVAKSREDVKVLLPEWLEALRTMWMDGDDVDAAALATLEHRFRLPTFYGLKICLTGFDNPEQRKYMQDTVSENGAEYHGDLTKSVTHLVAATPSGKKYEHAVNWRMKIVTWEWFEQSRERGMALDESCFHPTMAPADRGKGAWDRRASPSLGKRMRDAGQTEALNPLRRKLRRSASSKMGSQSEALWAGIMAPTLDHRKDEEDDWTDTNLTNHEISVAKASTTQTAAVTHATDVQPREDPASRARGPFSDDLDGIFQGRIVFPHGFDQSKTNILCEHLDSNGANVIRHASELCKFSSDDLRRGYLVISHDVPVDLTSLPDGSGDLSLVTNWWVERCLHGKRLVDPTDCVLCRPFDKVSISGFNDLTVNITGFTGIELLHVTKAVALFGATYDEILSPKTSVMICNTRKPNPDKFKFANDKGIPAVHAAWLWDCIQCGYAQPYDRYLLNTIEPQPQKPKEKPQASLAEVPTAPLSEEDSLKLKQKRAQRAKQSAKHRAGSKHPRPLELSVSGPGTPTSTTGSSTNPNTTFNDFSPDQEAPPQGGLDGANSLPLQDINPSVNSPRRPSTSSNGSTTYPNTKTSSTRSNSIADAPAKPVPAQRKSRVAKEPTPDSVIPAAADPPIPQETEAAPPKPKAQEKDYSEIMSKLLANRKISDSVEKEETGRRRRRPLGRAQSTRSNPSSAGDLLSLPDSAAQQTDLELGEDDAETTRKGSEIPQPSQVLGWDSPGAQKARERMIRAMGGKVEEGLNEIEEIGVVKDAVGETTYGRSSRKRR